MFPQYGVWTKKQLSAGTTGPVQAAELSSCSVAAQCWDHWICERSTPSCTSSHSGLISRSLVTCCTVSSTARSTSASVVKRPMPNRMEVCACTARAAGRSRASVLQADSGQKTVCFCVLFLFFCFFIFLFFLFFLVERPKCQTEYEHGRLPGV